MRGRIANPRLCVGTQTYPALALGYDSGFKALDLIMKRIACLVHIGVAIISGGCSNINLWPFEESSGNTRPGQRGPENATEYRCEGNKTFHVRYLEGGKSAWIFLPDRQVRLDKIAGEGEGRYTNGIATLVVQGMEAKLTDGPSISFSGCKTSATGSK